MIGIPSTFKISLRALRVNKMRSALTMLGIIIGVGAVITMLAVGTGASEQQRQHSTRPVLLRTEQHDWCIERHANDGGNGKFYSHCD